MTSSTWGVVIASGKGEKFGPDIDTAFLNIGSRPVLTYTLSAFEHCSDIEGVVIVGPKERLENIRVMVQMFGCYKVKKIVAGTNHRLSSVLHGLKALDKDVGNVVIHDASRPLVKADQLSDVIKSAKKNGSGVLASPVTDHVKLAKKGAKVTEALDSEGLWAVRAPQAFKYSVILKAMETATKKKADIAEDSAALALIKQDVYLVATDRPDLRISGPSDLVLAEFLLRS